MPDPADFPTDHPFVILNDLWKALPGRAQFAVPAEIRDRVEACLKPDPEDEAADEQPPGYTSTAI